MGYPPPVMGYLPTYQDACIQVGECICAIGRATLVLVSILSCITFPDSLASHLFPLRPRITPRWPLQGVVGRLGSSSLSGKTFW